VDIFTNAQGVLDAARQSWGMYPQTRNEPARIVRIGMIGDESTPAPPPPVYRGHQNLISIVSDSANYAICELDRGFAYAWVTPALVRDSASFRYLFLEAGAYLLIVSAYLAGVHAACVEWQGHGVLFAGDSGAGKSSMAYACARSGWTYISDDASYLVRNSDSLQVIGNPFHIRLRDSAASVFPEFADSAITSHPYRKKTIEVPTASLQDVKISCHSNVRTVIFLFRDGANPPEILPFPKEHALQAWSQGICFGADQVKAEHHIAFSKLLAADIYQLRYAETSTAVRFLENFLTEEK
jgi:hypothetical protein